MTTLRVTIDNNTHASLLTKLLHTMHFVKKVEEEHLFNTQTKSKDQFQYLKILFDSVDKGELFKKIQKPNQWQKNIRNEWK